MNSPNVSVGGTRTGDVMTVGYVADGTAKTATLEADGTWRIEDLGPVNSDSESSDARSIHDIRQQLQAVGMDVFVQYDDQAMVGEGTVEQWRAVVKDVTPPCSPEQLHEQGRRLSAAVQGAVAALRAVGRTTQADDLETAWEAQLRA